MGMMNSLFPLPMRKRCLQERNCYAKLMIMKVFLFFLASLFAMVAVGAESGVEQAQERYEQGAGSWGDVLKAEEAALLAKLVGEAPLPEIDVQGDNPLASYMEMQMTLGEASQQDVEKAREEWLRILQIGVVLRRQQPGEGHAALRKNLEEQLKLIRTREEAGVGSGLELLLVQTKLAAWFPAVKAA